ncbi:hypothetical protein TRFO_21404 [Tritrichomonas foetus]|uniref:Initiator binding domain-containing protein n=1 Tax=Tritrichomonas foetus TaxID=1144522 RepID=A0A1J4KEI1_9EUKA|nr:hypothetical protein TRFO_21404 [Tritrichomonas foetus]|eukprot:OHT09611.1 hypothetical protein TRFO_21404 [Tritrichomonas foetus]
MTEVVPEFFNLLSQDDQRQYHELRQTVGSPDNRYNRNKRLETFNEILDAIRQFCQRGDGEDWRRYLVCGVCWLGCDIAINTRQLRILILKSKSTINGALAKMGYTTIPIKSHDPTELVENIPFLKSHPQELRQWTTRRNSKMSLAQTPKESDFFNYDMKNNLNYDENRKYDNNFDSKYDNKFNDKSKINNKVNKMKKVALSPDEQPIFRFDEKEYEKFPEEIDFDKMLGNDSNYEMNYDNGNFDFPPFLSFEDETNKYEFSFLDTMNDGSSNFYIDPRF